MKILEIRNSRVIVDLNCTELETIINNYLDQQYCLGYDEGYNNG